MARIQLHPDARAGLSGDIEQGARPSVLLDTSVILAAAMGVFLSQLYIQRFFLHDDALISLRFAVNFVTTGALEWNLGERVEGYTNFLHILATSVLMKLGFDPIVAVRTINVASAAGLLAATWMGLANLLPRGTTGTVPAIGLALVLMAGPLPLWVFGGLETVMVAALVTAGMVAVLLGVEAADGGASSARDRYRLLAVGGVFLGCAVLTRPDAAAITAAAGLGVLLFQRTSPAERARSLMWLGVPAAAIVVAHVAWRYGYYGDLLPNTFYAKVSISLQQRLPNGVLYVLGSLFQIPALPVALSVTAVAGVLGRLSPGMKVLALAILVHSLSIVWAGGDHMPGARMMLPSLGMAALLCAMGIAALPEEQRLRAGALAFGAALLGGVAFGQEKMDKAAYYGTLVGQHLQKNERPGTLVSLSGAGAVPYHAPDLRFVDMLGLIDRTIARRPDVPILLPWQLVPGHAKGDGAYVLSRKPDIIVLGPPSGVTAADPWFLSDLEIGKHPEFARCYRLVTIDLAASPEFRAAAPRVHFDPVPFNHYRRHCRD